MIKLRVEKIVQEIYNIVDIASPPVKISKVICEACAKLTDKSNLDQIQEYAEAVKPQILKALESAALASKEDHFGYFASICLSDHSTEYVHGSCFIFPADDEKTKLSKNSRANVSNIEKMINDLSDRDFELLCGKIIELLGVTEPIVTRSSNDQGIDFFGLWPHEKHLKQSVLSQGMERQLKTWIFGQAKKYNKSVVSTSEIRELVGSVHLARAKSFSAVVSEYKAINIRPCDPVFHVFITSGRATSGVMDLMKASGIIFLDAHLTALFLADRSSSLRVFLSDQIKFVEWIRS